MIQSDQWFHSNLQKCINKAVVEIHTFSIRDSAGSIRVYTSPGNRKTVERYLEGEFNTKDEIYT